MGTRERAVLVGGNKVAAWVAREVLEGLGEFRVGDSGVEATDDGSDRGVGGECGEGEGGCGAVGGVLWGKGQAT